MILIPLKGGAFMYWNNYANILPNHLMNMYPETYKKLDPIIKNRCQFFYHSNNYMMNRLPDVKTINNIVEDIYDEYKRQKIQEGYEENDFEQLTRGRHDDPFKDLLKILIIKELIDNCRRPYCRPRRRHPWWY